MSKHLLWIISFLSIALIGDRLVGYIFSGITQKSLFRYSRLYCGKPDSANILFVGNSRGLTFYQPEVERITGMKTFNVSYNGMPADLAKNLVFDYLERNPAPKLMIIDATICDRENDALKSSFNLYTPYSHRLDTLIRGIHVPDKWSGSKIVLGGSMSHLYRFNTELFQRVLFHKNKTDADMLIDRVITESAVNDTSMNSYQVRMFKNMVADLKQMIDTAQAHGVKVQLVINPYYPPFADVVRDSFLSPLKSYVENATGLTIHDFSKSLTQRDELGDYQHANKKGSIHYMNILKDNGIFNPETNVMQFASSPTNNYIGTTPSSTPPVIVPEIKQENIIKLEVKPNTSVHLIKEMLSIPALKMKKNNFITPVKKRKPANGEGKDWISVDTAF